MNYDHNKLLESAGGDVELVGELIGIFRKEHPELLDRIEQAIQENQPQQLHEAAHKFKSPLSTMGAYAALDQIVALETMGINEDLKQAGIVFERLKKHIDILVTDLAKHDRVSIK